MTVIARTTPSEEHLTELVTGAPVEPEARMKELIETHSRPLYRFLLGLTFGERQAAEDLLQETLLRAWRKINELNTDVATLRPWLLTVARRIAIDAARARQARPAEVGTVELADLATGADEIERMLNGQLIRQAVAELSPEHRSVIVEFYLRGRSASETAALLGIPEGTIKSRNYHALRSLRATIERSGTRSRQG